MFSVARQLPLVIVILAAGTAGTPVLSQTVTRLDSFTSSTAGHDVTITPDGRWAVVSPLGTDAVQFIRLSDAVRFADFADFTGLPSGVEDTVAVTRNRAVLLAGGNDTVHIFDLSGTTPTLMRSFDQGTAGQDVAITPNGKWAVVNALGSGGIGFYRLRDAQRIQPIGGAQARNGPILGVNDTVEVTDERAVVLGGFGDTVRIFDISGAVPEEIAAHSHGVGHDVALTRDEKWAIVRAIGDGGIGFYALEDGQQVDHVGSADGALLFADDSVAASWLRAVVVGSATVKIFNLDGDLPELMRTYSIMLGQDVGISALGNWAVTQASSGFGFFRLFDGERISPEPFNNLGGLAGDDMVRALSEWTPPPRFPTSDTVMPSRAAVLGNQSVAFFDLTGVVPRELDRHTIAAGHDVAFSPGMSYAGIQDKEGNVKFFALDDGRELAAFGGVNLDPSANDSIIFSPDGSQAVALGGVTGGVRVWAIEGAGPIREVEKVGLDYSDGVPVLSRPGAVEASVSGDGRYVAYRTTNLNILGDILVYDRLLKTTRQVNVNGSYAGLFGSVDPALSADGRWVAFTSEQDDLVVGDTNGFSDILVHDRRLGTTERVSIGSDAEQGNGGSGGGALSGDGRFVVFASIASNLVPGDTNNVGDVFLRDRQAGTTTRILAHDGSQANDSSFAQGISADACCLVFGSRASNLVPGDTNGATDIFVHDRPSGALSRVSVSTQGVEANGFSWDPSISADGRFVAFVSFASNLVAGDSNNAPDVFVRDRLEGTTERVSVDDQGNQVALSLSLSASISGDGRYVAFHHVSSELVDDDTNFTTDVFVHDRSTSSTFRASVSRGGDQGNGPSYSPVLSFNGRTIVFHSLATNLALDDTNETWDVFAATRGDLGPDDDVDGVEDAVEDGAPNGGDGNADGVPDSEQVYVASLPSVVDGSFVTVAAPAGTELRDVGTMSNPSVEDAPEAEFPVGFLDFKIAELGAGEAVEVEVFLPPDLVPSTYWKYGPTPSNSVPHWYEFLFDGLTGAEVLSDRLILHLVDGERGDGDLTVNGEIVDPGAPSATAPQQGTIVITLDAPDSNGLDVMYSGDLGAFTLDDDNDVAVPGSLSFTVDPGRYDVSESVPDSLELNALECADPDGGTQTILQTATARVDLDAGETIHCTYIHESAGPCFGSSSAICLNESRFRVSVEWADGRGNGGSAQVAELHSGNSALFWFFGPNNWEMLVKVLNGCNITDHFWVFSAATTNVEYTLTITDTLAEVTTSYFNPLGSAAAAITDTEALATCDFVDSASPSRPQSTAAGGVVSSRLPGSRKTNCAGGESGLCLNSDRFNVEVEWRNTEGETGLAQAVPGGTDDSGVLWFFSPANWEMLVKVLDGCRINDRFWVFAAATTNVEYTLRVTDTETGTIREYVNPLGVAADAITDIGAFATCP